MSAFWLSYGLIEAPPAMFTAFPMMQRIQPNPERPVVAGMTSIVCSTVTLLLGSNFAPTIAQTLDNLPPLIPPVELSPRTPQGLDQDLPGTTPDQPRFEPTTPILPPPPTPDQEIPAINTNLTVRVNRVELVGNTVFSETDLAPIFAKVEGREVTFDELIALRQAITDLYVAAGYVTSGAFLPPQDVTDGVIRVQAVEGVIEAIEITGLQRLREKVIRDRLEQATQPPLSLPHLEAALQMLQLDPQLAGVRASLESGTRPGQSLLVLDLDEAPAVNGSLSIDNHDPPSVGSVRYSAALGWETPLGLGDRLFASYGFTAGIDSFSIGYTLPTHPHGNRLRFAYDSSHSRIIEAPFDELGIRSRSERFNLGWDLFAVNTPTDTLSFGVDFDVRRVRTFLLEDEPFSFSEGPDAGRSNLSVLRLSQSWVSRSRLAVLAARSRFSFGIDALNATRNSGNTADGLFFSWLGQAQWVRSLGADTLLVSQFAAQLTPHALLPIEQFSIGGFDTVRGYLQNQRVGDNGLVSSIELRYPIVRDPDGWGILQVVPFLDAGTVWNTGDQPLTQATLVSLGMGLRWQWREALQAEIDWAIPLVESSDRGDSLQGSGVTFSVNWLF